MPCLLVALVWIWAVPSAGAATLTVGPPGEGEYERIQSAISAAAAGDTVLVYPGRYLETLSITDVDIHLISAAGPATTIIDGNGSGPVVRCLGISQSSSIEGFTITGGVTGKPLAGGGIYLTAYASPLIKGNVVIRNRAEATGAASSAAGGPRAPDAPTYCEPEPGSGGGIYVHFTCMPDIVDNTIVYNEAKGNGGGVVFWDHANALMEGNRIYRNSAGRNGGGVYVGCNASPTMEGNVIAWNSALVGGGGVFLDGFEADAAVLRNTLYMNSALSGAGGIQCAGPCRPVISANLIGVAAGGGVQCDAETDATVTCNVVWGAGGDAFGGDCFPLGVSYAERDNAIMEVALCGVYAGDFRPCRMPLEDRCGQVGAEDRPCPRGTCGHMRVTWGMLKSIYRSP